MKVVIDTNVVISGVFFGGYPRMVLDAVLDEKISVAASSEIIDEYIEIIEEMISRKQGTYRSALLAALLQRMEIVEPISDIHLSRDPDDDKFISCANDARAMYIVSGDKDLLVLRRYKDIEIITAKDFCDKYL